MARFAGVFADTLDVKVHTCLEICDVSGVNIKHFTYPECHWVYRFLRKPAPCLKPSAR